LVDTRQVQLPEPFSGRRSILRLGLVGMNPGYDPDERFPIVSWLSHATHRFFVSRFDHRGPRGALGVRHWDRIESFFRENILCCFRLGVHARMYEVNRFKSAGQAWFDASRMAASA
jgi:hypothetical protein